MRNMDLSGMKRNYDIRTGVSYSFEGQAPDFEEKFNQDFMNFVYRGARSGLTSYTYSEQLLHAITILERQGKFDGYGFLQEMPEDEALEWLSTALRKCITNARRFPEQWQPLGCKQTFDKLRAERKAKKAAAKAKKESGT